MPDPADPNTYATEPPLQDPAEPQVPETVTLAGQEPLYAEQPQEGFFRFKPSVYEGRRFGGSIANGQAISEWCGRCTIQMTPTMNILRVVTSSGELVCYPGQWVLRLDNDFLVLSEEALNGRMEPVTT